MVDVCAEASLGVNSCLVSIRHRLSGVPGELAGHVPHPTRQGTWPREEAVPRRRFARLGRRVVADHSSFELIAHGRLELRPAEHLARAGPGDVQRVTEA